MQFTSATARHGPGLGGQASAVRAANGGRNGAAGGRRNDRVIVSLMRVIPLFMDLTMRVLGPLLVLFAWGLFSGVTYIYFWHILPLRELDPLTFPGVIYTGVGVWILVNLFYNHASAVFTSPGHLPDSIPVPGNIDDLIADEAPLLRRGENFAKYCRTCVKPKPERAHHCHICHRCVLKMDHHCPWIANCVGHGNYKFFFLFLMYLWIGCVYLVLMCLPTLFYQSPPLLRRHEGPVFFGLVLGCSAGVALAMMGGLHLYLIMTNQSTIELYHNRRQKGEAARRGESWSNPFDLGWRKNFQSVFGVGQYWFSWTLPGKPDIGDGMRWPRAASSNELDVRAV
jgi:palmitoyltransferase